MPDTHPEIERMLVEAYRRMSPEEKILRVSELNRRTDAFAEAVIR